jgi:predicted MFS family arabinose efflux permease
VDAAAPRRLKVFDAFRHRDFRLLWTGQVISAIGDAAFFTALAWRAFTLAGSQKTGIVFLCQGAGLLTTLLIGGALADRLPRRMMMIASDLARCVVIATLAGIDAADSSRFRCSQASPCSPGWGTAFSSPPSAASCRSSSRPRRCRRRTA